jgi:predicted phage gp36 major capsid-like protein
MTGACLIEVRNLNTLARELRAKGKTAEAAEIEKRADAINKTGFSSDELREKYTSALVESTGANKKNFLSSPEYRSRFDRYLAAKADEVETRDLQVGQQTVSWTSGLTGGYLVPFAYDETMRNAMATVDPILDDAVTDFSMTDGPFLQPGQISGYDLSNITAQLIGEDSQVSDQGLYPGGFGDGTNAEPPALGAQLRNNLIYRTTWRSSIEAETDARDEPGKIVRGISTALARRVAKSVFAGQGGADMTGITKALLNQGQPLSNATPGKITNTDITNWFFAVNDFYRNSPKCSWLCTDAGLKLIRNAVDGQGRPLLDMADGFTLLSKPLRVCPSLANNTTFRSLGLSSIIFGDCSHIVIRSSRPTVQRLKERFADFGEAAYLGRWRADCSYFDPSGGINPPLALVAVS